jgi:YT521-B-like domain
MNLVQHVNKEAPGVESVFLMSKTNCAFANFKDEEQCAAAQAKIHDSRFQNVGLTCRLRRNSVGVSASVSTPADPTSDPIVSSESASPVKDAEAEAAESERDNSSSAKDKFFIVKSHTVEDLELSIRNGTWATQSHNEAAFNKAYQACHLHPCFSGCFWELIFITDRR